MKLIIIAAMARNRVIGCENRIPWHIPEEMHHFKKNTMGHALIMGRKTHQSIGRSLPGRKNVVLSSDREFSAPDCTIATSLAAGIRLCRDQEKVFIIGGQMLYEEAMGLADALLLSIIDRDYAGDAFFPPIPEKEFRLVAEEQLGVEQSFTLQSYDKITKAAF